MTTADRNRPSDTWEDDPEDRPDRPERPGRRRIPPSPAELSRRAHESRARREGEVSETRPLRVHRRVDPAAPAPTPRAAAAARRAASTTRGGGSTTRSGGSATRGDGSTARRETSAQARARRAAEARVEEQPANPVLPQCWQDVEDVLAAGVDRLILFGPPGTGKTFAGLNLGKVGAGAYRVACTEDMTEADITGCWMPNAAGTWSWNEGKAIRAWEGDGRSGGRLVLDEIDRANGDIESLLLAVTDSVGSLRWEHPETGRTVRPRSGFSVVMTTNLEHLEDLPVALRDRFPVAIRIDQPHPDALATLPVDLRAPAAAAADADPGRRFSIRTFQEFARLRDAVGPERAARLVFGAVADDILDALLIDGAAA